MKQIHKKLVNLLYKEDGVYDGSICFDFSSYEYEDDIPYVIINNTKILVLNVYLPKDETFFIITSDTETDYVIDLNDYNEDELIAMNIYGLFQDIYYETSYSYEIGDFEEEFLKN